MAKWFVSSCIFGRLNDDIHKYADRCDEHTKKKHWASSQMATDSLKVVFFPLQLYINATLTCLNGDCRKKKNIDH